MAWPQAGAGISSTGLRCLPAGCEYRSLSGLGEIPLERTDGSASRLKSKKLRASPERKLAKIPGRQYQEVPSLSVVQSGTHQSVC
jgi:hypothetical protein